MEKTNISYTTEYELCFEGEWFLIPKALALKLRDNPAPFVPNVRASIFEVQNYSFPGTSLVGGSRKKVNKIPEGAKVMDWF